MLEGHSSGAVTAAISDILRTAPTRGRAQMLRDAQAYINHIVRLDYGAAMKKHFDRQQLRSVYKDIREALPTLNQEVFRIRNVKRLARIADGLGAELKAYAFNGSEGTALRGFYVNEATVLKQPLIWVNTATHPTAMAAAFWHEIGHHVTNRLWDTRRVRMNLEFGSSNREDLTDPKELIADIVRVLAGYPWETARRLFGRAGMEDVSRDADLLFATVRPYVKEELGLDFASGLSPRANLYLLGGVIHVAKLRATLLTEYGI
jgi:hypothetical protein